MQMENFAPIMFAGLVLIMLIGFPVAFSLAALGLASGFLAIEMGWFPASFMSNLPLNMFGILSNELLLAIPFFTFMGAILEKCGLAEDMLDSMGQLFGPAKGGLGYSVIIVGFILGAITGTVAGQVIAMAMNAHSRPRADSENATGNPISMIRMSPPNIIGAKFSIWRLIAAASRSGCLRNHQARLLSPGEIRDGYALRKTGSVIRLHRSPS